ncbi:hypothetical protein BKI52_31510 [marine bacterium AO1-C]|nr:hypothetical protein BKI52_31510 [marine bacterium AO1-C]
MIIYPSFAQAQKITQADSLVALLNQSNANADKARLLISLAEFYHKKSTNRSVDYARQALKLSEKLNYQKGIGESMYYLAIGQFNQSKFTSAQDYLNKASILYRGIDDQKGVANAQKQLGKIYDRLGDYDKALEHHVNSLKINEGLNNQRGTAAAYLEISRVYDHRSDYFKSLEYSREALSIARTVDADDLLAEGYKNLATTYQKIPEYKQALTYYQRALKIFQQQEDQKNISTTLLGIGEVYLNAQQTNKALENLLKAREIQQAASDQEGLGYASLGIGRVYTAAKNYKRALDYLNKSLETFKSIQSKKPISESYLYLAEAYEKQQKYQQAYQNYQLYKAYTDSLYNETRSLQIAEMQTRLDLRTKESEIKRLNKEQELKDLTIKLKNADISRQSTILVILLASTGAILALAFVLFNSRLKLRRTNRKLLQQNKEIDRQKKIVEGQHRKITDGLRYAETIQLSILPHQPRIQEFFHEHFVIYKAKDMVSGDFYWIDQIDDKIVTAVLDCTGHGVSGAFMSMVGNTLLNEIVRQRKIISPAVILEELHQGVVESLRKQESNLDLGMEACICVIEKSDQEKQQLIFAGAKRPLYYIHDETITEIRGNRSAVGFDFGKKRIFENKTLDVEKGGVLYLTTDGFSDQAGEHNQRLGRRRFQDLLVAYSKLPLDQQKENLEKALQKHQKNTPQRDDITILAVRI